MKEAPPDSARTARPGETPGDIIVSRNGRHLAMLGQAGPERELAILPANESPVFAKGDLRAIPVLIGTGTALALNEMIRRLKSAHGENFLLIVVDKEKDILAANDALKIFSGDAGILWVDEPDSGDALKKITLFQEAHGGLPLAPVLNPFYSRLDRHYYSAVQKACEASSRVNFWQNARQARFLTDNPRVLLLTTHYFLIGEIKAACERLGYEYRLIQVNNEGIGQSEFLEQLLSAAVKFRPDFAFTINHLGIDREGVLTDLFEKLRLPLASWFVDNPHLILSLYSGLATPWTTLFTWDADNLDSLKEVGFKHVFYMPLGTDVTRFKPAQGMDAGRLRQIFPGISNSWNGDIAFVGNSMVKKVAARMGKSNLPRALLAGYQEVAGRFALSEERTVGSFLAGNYPALLPVFESLPSIEDRLNYETMLTWEATLQYRQGCIKGILGFAPLLVGDSGWKQILPRDTAWSYHPEMSYYEDLPLLYPSCKINFNCTSQQMKGAVNQRVFDVPATGSFLLTDYREQVENLFEPDREIVCFNSPEEAGELAKRYLAAPKDREAVAKAALQRVLAEHTYDHRLKTLAGRMREIYG